jgi:hypothetical protein
LLDDFVRHFRETIEHIERDHFKSSGH